MSDSFPPEQARRTVKSFVLRAGRMGTGQARALEDLGPRFLIAYTPKPLDLDAAFGRAGPKILEIGFGMGDSTATIAASLPGNDYLGVEVHTPGVGALLKRIGEGNLGNLRIIQHDAVEVLNHMLADGSLDGIHIFFPDPWPKKKHQKRRLIQSEFVALLARKLRPDGYLHLATDWEHYAMQMLDVLSGERALRNTAPDFSPRPDYRPLTKFEKRGLKLGHGVWDLIFRKTV
ncbi:MAG: tRNA (guanosine(46)-N7)-methyltransferase TrmB [Parasulfuritortus sp.]|jgi:tRNA (guanine-N7-)-methyltransferase|nr:tRNA (guanosine(46)-N7)-methyltransferase TrmB [Parasulfuritortus sp.]